MTRAARDRDADRLGPLLEAGRIWWGATSVSPDAYAEARVLLKEPPKKKRGRPRKEPKAEPIEDPIERRLTVQEVADIVRKSTWSISEYLKAGARKQAGFPVHGPYILGAKVGREWRVSRAELAHFIARAEGRER